MGIFGDFSVSDYAHGLAKDYHEGRDPDSKRVDKQKRAPVTTDYQQWRSSPGELDYPGVDTPTNEPSVLPKDLQQQPKPGLAPEATGRMPTDISVDDPDLERTRLLNTDLSLSPDEAFGRVGGRDGAGPPVQDRFGRFDMTPEEEQEEIDRLASGVRADLSFIAAEERR